MSAARRAASSAPAPGSRDRGFDLDRRGVQWRKFNEINLVNIHYKKSTYANWEPMKSGLNSDVKLWPME